MVAVRDENRLPNRLQVGVVLAVGGSPFADGLELGIADIGTGRSVGCRGAGAKSLQVGPARSLASRGRGKKQIEKVLRTRHVSCRMGKDVVGVVVHALSAARAAAGEHEAADQSGIVEGHLLCDEAPQGEAEKIDGPKIERLDESRPDVAKTLLWGRLRSNSHRSVTESHI